MVTIPDHTDTVWLNVQSWLWNLVELLKYFGCNYHIYAKDMPRRSFTSPAFCCFAQHHYLSAILAWNIHSYYFVYKPFLSSYLVLVKTELPFSFAVPLCHFPPFVHSLPLLLMLSRLNLNICIHIFSFC